jgi:hypothetical protein
MQLIREFIWEKNQTTHGYGWRPVSMPQFDAGGPLHVAHDVLEHESYSDGSLEEEMRALGATIFLRGEGGWYRHISDNSEQVNFAKSSALDTASFIFSDKRPLPAPESVPEVPTRATMFLRTTKRWAENNWDSVKNMVRQDAGWSAAELAQRLEAALAWAKIGYTHAATRYAGLTKHDRLNMFKAVEDAVSRTQYLAGPGDTMTLIVDTETKSVDRKIVHAAGNELSDSERMRRALYAMLGVGR